MKRWIAFLLCALMILPSGLSAAPNTAQAATRSIGTVQEVLYAMELFSQGSNLADTITRAELAKVVVSVSPQRTAVPAKSTTSPFRDVKHNYWAAPYIKLAASSGYMNAYSDGSFRPANAITLEEATTSFLKIMGYSTADYGVDYPYGPLSFATTTNHELLKNVTAKQGGTITRQDLMWMTYNALDCTTKSGVSLLTSMGYTRVNPNEALDILSVYDDETTGPVTLKSGVDISQALSIKSGDYTVYRNEVLAASADLATNDVLYYSKSKHALYAYSKSVTGILQSVGPSRQTPATVTVAGATYTLEGTQAKDAVNMSGNCQVGDAVILLFGMNTTVSDVLLLSDNTASEYGLVLDAGRKAFVAGDGGSYQSYYATISNIDGQSLTYPTTNDASGFIGQMARITFADGKATIYYTAYNQGLHGSVDAAARTIGETSFAPGAKILEYEGGATYPTTLSRLDGMSANNIKVLYCTLNSKKQIESMFITDTTGDYKAYGLVRYIKNTSQPSANGGINTDTAEVGYDVAGATGTLTFTNMHVNYPTVPSVFTLNSIPTGNKYTKIEPLKELGEVTFELSSVRTAKNASFAFADNVLIYHAVDGVGTLITVDQAKALTNVVFTAYYDKPLAEGGRVRVILVRNK